MVSRITLKQMATAALSVFALVFCSYALAEEAGAGEKTKEVPANQSSLSFMDDQQAWTASEEDSYKEWIQRNQRYSHPILKSQWEAQNGKPAKTIIPPYRASIYNRPFYTPPGAVGVRSRILWVYDRYPNGKYYSSSNMDKPADTAEQK